MKLSQYFWYDFKDIKDDEGIISYNYSLRGGFIKKLVSGIYLWNPSGLRVLKKIENIIREEMNKAGAHECLLSCIQPAELWIQSGRYEDYGKEMLRIQDRHEKAMLFGPTHEEVMTNLFSHYVKSYRGLPINLYQIQWKFRDERRPRFGLMRGREFLMKDAYSFDLDHEGAVKSYNNMYKTYFKIFKKLGLEAIAVKADTGPIGGDLSHEFQVFAKNGESTTYYDPKLLDYIKENDFDIETAKQFYAMADEMHQEEKIPNGVKIESSKAIEIGHLFNFDTKYSEPLNAKVQHQDGKNLPVYMGSYGIGVSRLFAAIIEASHDDKGIIWPESVAPFKYAILDGLNLLKTDDSFYKKLEKNNFDFIYDDKNDSLSEKFKRWDLFGIPYQIIIGKKYRDENLIEIKSRKTKEIKFMSIDNFIINMK
jgi:prolyl-tRNA synthetase